jgi:pimeloyl-ACP methyl ester carboxylesterase
VPTEAILTEVSLEWFTNTSATVGRYHYEEAHAAQSDEEAGPRVNHAPLGVAVFQDDFKSIRTFAERDNDNIVHWSEFPRGGHFASLELPDEVTGDIRLFFRTLRGA